MDYRYKRGQIFKKKLDVPRGILIRIYSNRLSLKEFMDYELYDKIPISCLSNDDRRVVEKFGVEKLKNIDWDLRECTMFVVNEDFNDLIMSIDSSTEDLNLSLYELVKDKIKPNNYTDRMKQFYSGRLIDISSTSDTRILNLGLSFNYGDLTIEQIICNWDIFKDKDLSFCLSNDVTNKFDIKDSDLKQFMFDYGDIVPLIIEEGDIYSFINNVINLKEEERKKYIKTVTDDILSNTYREYGDYRDPIHLTDEEYKKIFKYSSFEEYLKIFDEYYASKVIEELKSLPDDYIFNTPFSFSELLSYDVLRFVGIYGIQNVVDFDKECGHFFSNNNCEMLKLMEDMYMHYAGNVYDSSKTIYTKKRQDDQSNDSERLYTKDEFYEAIRRMLVYGPSNGNYFDKLPDYSVITGEFRDKNQDIFMSEDAPEDLRKRFYLKSLTPIFISENPDYISYLKGKNLSSCFKKITIKVSDSDKAYGYENLYDFLEKKLSFEDLIAFISEYGEVYDIIYDQDTYKYAYVIDYSFKDTIEQTKSKIDEMLRKVLIEKGVPFPKKIPQKLKEEFPSMFISDDAPQELQDAYYNRKISSEYILSNPTYIDFLKQVDLDFLYQYMPVKVENKNISSYYKYNFVNLIDVIRDAFGKEDSFDVMLLYGKYIEKIYKEAKFYDAEFSSDMSKDGLLDVLDSKIYDSVVDGIIRYDDNAPIHFRNNYPTLFLKQDVSQEIRSKFYNRMFTLEDFDSNPELIDIFHSTNIVCGFPEDMSWIIPLFSDGKNPKLSNLNRLKVISVYSKIEDLQLKRSFKEYIKEFGNDIDIDKIECVSDVLSRIEFSNSIEVYRFRRELSLQILKSENPQECLSMIEDVFIRNNLPTVGKVYSCFEILHPDFEGFNFGNARISPALRKSTVDEKKLIVFSDLIKASFGSNNKSVIEYLKNIDVGSSLYESIKSGKLQYDELDDESKNVLLTFSNHLATLYNNSMISQKKDDSFVSSGDILNDILDLSIKLSPNGTLDYNLGDRVIRMFCGLAGINTLEEAKNYVVEKVKKAELRNRNAANFDAVLEQGDFVKGIGDITYLRNILQNGSVSKEYLGSSADSDATPLDTDVSKILNSEGNIGDKLGSTAACSYGPIWFALKNDDRFLNYDGDSKIKRDLSKLEVFYTGVLGDDHYGIRTGFASSEINYIIMENYNPCVGLEIAMNGFYIPIANFEGKIIFTPQDYDQVRAKMSGLSYYGENNYLFSKNLIINDVEYFASQIEQSNNDVLIKRTKINDVIKKSLDELGLQLKTKIDGNLADGFVELIDTGSTGRGTNKPGDGDFDFMMRLDRRIISNPVKLNELKTVLLKNLGREYSSEIIGTGDFRLKGVQIDADTCVDIDITFTEKTDKVSYSTDMSLQDRLSTIKNLDSEKYKYVIANILLAKKVLKDAGCYKPYRSDNTQGGLGGVGIENWILQNGGSFVDASKSFIDVAEGKSFSEFQLAYQIWDFGDNHLAERRGQYSHDNFVSNNMSEDGYKKMVDALKEFLKKNEYDNDSLKR